MIYTITVNPALDVTNVCEEPIMATTLRPKEQWRHAGGKGIDVSRVIRNLGGRSVVMGFLGGFTGRIVEGLLLAEGLELDLVQINEETRTNVIIMAPGSPTNLNEVLDYRFNSPWPEVQPFEYLELYHKIDRLKQTSKGRRASHAAVCGSLCKGMHPTFYVTIIRYFKDIGAVVALDSSGTAMKESLRYEPRPDIIKPNIVEFNELMGGSITKYAQEEVAKIGEAQYLRQKCATGCGDGKQEPDEFWKILLGKAREANNIYPDITAILITLGEGGILLVLKESIYHARLNEPLDATQIVSTVGAGDSALAAFIYSRDIGEKWEASLELATAAGTAAITKKGTESPSEEEVPKI